MSFLPESIASTCTYRHYATKGCDSKVYFASYTPVDRCFGDSDIHVSGPNIRFRYFDGYDCRGKMNITLTVRSAECNYAGAGSGVYYSYSCNAPRSITPTTSPSASLLNTYTAVTSKSCFAGSETVRMESGEIKLISEVVVGDRVQSSDVWGKISYSEVIYIPHKTNRHKAVFSHLVTESGRDIKVTQDHLIVAGACGTASASSKLPLKYANQVSIGDCVMTESGPEMVTKVENVHSEGVYTIVTNKLKGDEACVRHRMNLNRTHITSYCISSELSEFLVVSGFIASPFGKNHMLANMYYNMHRMVYAVAPWILSHPTLHSVNEELGRLAPLFGYRESSFHEGNLLGKIF